MFREKMPTADDTVRESAHTRTREDRATVTQSLRKQLADEARGPVWYRGDEGFEKELEGFQAGLRHHPAVVVGAESADDVRAAVRYAVAQGAAVAVQSTGHGLTVL